MFFVLIVVGVILFFVKGIIGEKQKRKEFIHNLSINYGKELNRRYKNDEYEHIASYANKYKKAFFIDDITWNDLNMDAIFMQMNYTHSSAGEEYLYSMLRNIRQEDSFSRLEELIYYFQNQQEERIKLQTAFHDIGRTGKFSLCDYLDHLEDLGERKNIVHILWNLMFIPAIFLLMTNITYGLLILLGIIIHNIITYFKAKEEMSPYIISFSYVFRLLNGISILQGQKVGCIAEEVKELVVIKKKFKKFDRFAFLVMNQNGGSGNPLEGIFDYLRMCFHLDIIKFNDMLKEVRIHSEDIKRILEIVGEIDSAIAIGEYRKYLGDYCVPEFNGRLAMEDGYHPLIKKAVKNSIYVEKNVLLTGSNASGKSTFLKTVAINALLAQSIHTCAAKSFQGNFYRIYTSMALRDDIFSGESYYMVEIRSLKRILDGMNETDSPVLCFVDEVLRGTNTVERIAASTQILKTLGSENVVCFAATHDIELTSLLEGQYDNYHFEEEMIGDDIIFHYQLLQGKATTRNAIKLLDILGYQSSITEQANVMASRFVETGQWSNTNTN